MRNTSPGPHIGNSDTTMGLHLQNKFRILLSYRYDHNSRALNYRAHTCALPGTHLDSTHYFNRLVVKKE